MTVTAAKLDSKLDSKLNSRVMSYGIAGGGLLGRLMAWRLAREGHRVTVFDSGDVQGRNSAGYVAAAMLAPYSELLNAEPLVFEQGLKALEIWPQWLAELKVDSGIAVPYQQKGSLVVAHQQDMADLQRFYQRLSAYDCVPPEHVHRLDHNGIAELEPELAAKFRQGIYLDQEGCLSNWDLYQALGLALSRFGVTWNESSAVESLASRSLLLADGRRQSFDCVLDCRGFGAKADLAQFRGVRGEVLWVQAPEVALSRPVRLMHPRYQLYIAPKPDNVFVIGATEIESESLSPMTVRSSLELQSALYSVHTGFAEANILESFANLRPAFIDNLPRIEHASGLMRINGLYRHGYLLSPYVVTEAMKILSVGV